MTIFRKVSRFLSLSTIAVALAVGVPTLTGCATLQKAESSVVKATDALSAVIAALAVTDELAASYIDGLTDPTEQELKDVETLKDLVAAAYTEIKTARMALMAGNVNGARLGLMDGLGYLLDVLRILDSKGVDVGEAVDSMTKALDVLEDLNAYCASYLRC